MTTRRGASRLAALTGVGLLFLFGASPLHAQVETPSTLTPNAYLVVLASTLNVRGSPDLAATVVATAARSERLCLIRYDGDWAEIESPPVADESARIRGFVSRGFVSERRAGREELTRMGCLEGRPRP